MLDEHQFRIVGVNPVGKFAIGDEEHLIDPRSITLYSSKPVAENIHFPETPLPLINTLALQTFAYIDVTNGGVFNRLSADYALNDQLHAILGYDYFHADSGMFTIYKKNSEFWVKLKYSF